uniref:C-type lectin domain-containing protein n=1 Tax=Nothobranchius pienaari TaxID=704102 RepID=A0A1A8LL79_9TELE
MTEADVTYSDVRFARPAARENVSSSVEATYTEVKFLKRELPGGNQTVCSNEPKTVEQTARSGRSKVTSERAALVVLSVLLAAAVAALGVIVFYTIQTSQTQKEENEALRRNISETKPCSSKPSSPPPPTPDINQPSVTCEGDWELFRGHFYYFTTNYSTWKGSRGFCEALGADLVKIDSREEQDFLVGKVKAKMEFPEDKFWIGLTDSENESSWIWVDGSPLNTNLAFWRKSEPDNWAKENQLGEDCVRMGEKGAEDLKCWFDKSCDAPQKSICEKLPITDQKHKCEVQFHKRA